MCVPVYVYMPMCVNVWVHDVCEYVGGDVCVCMFARVCTWCVCMWGMCLSMWFMCASMCVGYVEVSG